MKRIITVGAVTMLVVAAVATVGVAHHTQVAAKFWGKQVAAKFWGREIA